MQTTLLDRDNKVAQQWGGSGWNPGDVANAVAALALQAGR
jgi:hypothetical protein